MTDKYVTTRVLQKIDLAATWITNNPILLKGEIGIESDTHKLKIGDGTSNWTNLNYVDTDTLDGHDSTYFASASSLNLKQDPIIGGTNISIDTDKKTINWTAPVDGVYYEEIIK